MFEKTTRPTHHLIIMPFHANDLILHAILFNAPITHLNFMTVDCFTSIRSKKKSSDRPISSKITILRVCLNLCCCAICALSVYALQVLCTPACKIHWLCANINSSCQWMTLRYESCHSSSGEQMNGAQA